MRYIILSLIFTLTSYSQNEDIRLNGTVGAEGNQIKNVGDPTDAQDVVTKSYLNAIIANLQSQIDDLTTSGEQLYADGTDIDQDDNTFEWINYGTQDWAIENAEVVRYRDGTIIPQVADTTEWISLTTGAWCYYNNDPSKGKLYNWYAVAGIHDNDESTPNKEFAPQGWHVPSDAEWTTLEEHLVANGYNYDGSSTGYKTAKSMASTTGWNSSTFLGAVGNDQSLNNSSGFNALPDGYLGHGDDASFYNDGYSSYFWSSTEYLTTPYARYLDRNNNYLYRNYSTKVDGFSVRFVKD